MSPTTLTFPHTELTPVLGKPTNSSIQLLQRQLYTNARSITSPRGGGNNGHLALLMSEFDYFARAGIAFTIPVHPDVAPIHSVGATSAQIAETIRLYNQELAAHTLYHQVSTALKSQILAAVEITYLRALENADFGFADVTPLTMLKHLKTTYGVLTPEALEANRSTLTTPWNPDDPIEDLWKRIEETQRIATTGGAPITDEAVIALTLTMFEKSGLLSHTTQIWRVKPIVYWNWTGFKTDFTMANTERRRQITAGAAGYHGAHAAITPPQDELAALAITPTAPSSPSTAASSTIVGRMVWVPAHNILPQPVSTRRTATKTPPPSSDDTTVATLSALAKHAATTTVAMETTAATTTGPSSDPEGRLPQK